MLNFLLPHRNGVTLLQYKRRQRKINNNHFYNHRQIHVFERTDWMFLQDFVKYVKKK